MFKKLIPFFVLLLVVAPAWADWDPNNSNPKQATNHKMHYPQMPDPNGWDVDVTTGFVADDWRCSQSGPVDDIHFWISAKGDNWGNGIDFIEVDARIEQTAGLQLSEIFELHGEAYYRRLEREVLTRMLTAGKPAVLATGGSIVNDRDNYSILRERQIGRAHV